MLGNQRLVGAKSQRLASKTEWACLCVGLLLIYRYRWVLDDSTIYYRYVDNLLFLKRGLVFNDLEYVEGYSSPLWLLLLIPLRATHLDYWTLTLVVGCVSWLLFWAALVYVNRRLSGTGSGPAINLPLLLLGTAYGPLSYFTSGSESPLMQLAAAAVAIHVFRRQSWLWQALLGLLPLVRNEFLLPLLVLVVGHRLLWRRTPWVMVHSALIAGLSWTAFRIYYYADFFPNTYYLKDKVDIRQGLYYLVNGFGPYGLLAMLLFSGLTAIGLWRVGNHALYLRERALLVVVAVSGLLYVVKVGGDMMHYRMLAFPFCLLAIASGGVAESVATLFQLTSARSQRELVASLLGFASFLAYPRFLSQHPVFGHEERMLDRGISDAAWHRHLDKLAYSSERKHENHDLLTQYARLAPSHRNVVIDTFCANMFQKPPMRFVHAYGLTEPILARVNIQEERPGHKMGLFGLANDLATLRTRAISECRENTVSVINKQYMPQWIVNNVATIQHIERRMYNHHDFLANLRLALTNPGRIRIGRP